MSQPQQTQPKHGEEKDALSTLAQAHEHGEKMAQGEFNDYQKEAEKMKSDPNFEAARLIDELNGSAEVITQMDGITALHQALASILSKLEAAGANIQKIKTPRVLRGVVSAHSHHLELTLPEKTALENLERITSGSGPTAKHIQEMWPDTIEAAGKTNKGVVGWYREKLKENTWGTIGLTVLGAAGLYLSFQTIKAIWEKDKPENEKTEKDRKWFLKHIFVPITIGLIGGKMGWSTIKRLLADEGLDAGKVKAEAVAGEVSEETKKKAEAAGPAVAAAVNQIESQYGGEEEQEGGKSWFSEEAREERREVKEHSVELAEQEAEEMKYIGPKVTMIELFCHDEVKYPHDDKLQISRAIDDMQDQSIEGILALWEQYRQADHYKAEIPHSNGLMNFNESYLEARNIYTAVMVIGLSAARYKKSFPELDYSNLKLRDFIHKYVFEDSVGKINTILNESISNKIASGNIIDVFNFTDVSLEGVGSALKTMSKNFIESLAADYHIELEGVSKEDFTVITTKLYTSATLEMNAEEALKHIDISKYDPAAIEASKKFFDAVRAKTTNEIIPAAKSRFNLDRTMVRNKANADIINQALGSSMSFESAVQLNVVTRGIRDFNLPPDQASNAPQELAFLFAVLSTIEASSPEQKSAYMSELTILFLKSPSDIPLPSLALMQPAFKGMVDVGVEKAKSKYIIMGKLASAVFTHRTGEEYAEHLEEMRNANALTYAVDVTLEGVGGAIQIPVEFITTTIKAGAITTEEWAEAESAWDITQLIAKAGGTLLFHKDERGVGHGAIAFAGNYFVFKPIGIIKETADALLDGEPTGAMKVWIAGSATTMTLGAAKGFFAARGKMGGWLPAPKLVGAGFGAFKSLGYPLQAPAWALERTTSILVRGADLARSPKRAVESIMNWGSELKNDGSWQSVRNMTDIGHRVKHYSGADLFDETNLQRELIEDMRKALKDGDYGLIERVMEEFRLLCAELKLPFIKAKEFLHLLVTKPGDLARLLAETANAKLARVNARAYVIRCNKFFGKKILEIPKNPVPNSYYDDLCEKIGRFENFLEWADENPDAFEKMRKLIDKNPKKTASALLKFISNDSNVPFLWAEAKAALSKKLRTVEDIDQLQKTVRTGAAGLRESVPTTPSRVRLRATIPRTLVEIEDALKVAQDEIKALDELRASGTVVDLNAHLLKKQEIVDRIKELEDAKAIVRPSEATADTERLLANADEMIRSVEVTEHSSDLLKATQADLDEVNERMEKLWSQPNSEKEGSKTAEELKKLIETQRVLREQIEELETLAALRGNLKKIEAAMETTEDVREMEKYAEELRIARRHIADGEKAFAEKAKIAAELVEESGSVSKLAKVLAVLPGLAAIGSLYMGGQSAYEALTTDIEGRAGIEGSYAAMWGVDAALGIGETAALLTGSAAAAPLGVAGLALIPFTYLGENIHESAKEGNFTEAEWARKFSSSDSYERLMHEWLSTANSYTYGDKARLAGKGIISGFDFAGTLEDISKEKQDNLHKIYRVLIAEQVNPNIFPTLAEGSDEEVSRAIDQSCSKYHEYYFKKANPETIQEFDNGQNFISEALLFDRLMKIRDGMKEKGVSAYIVAGINLLDPKYDIDDNGNCLSNLDPNALVDHYKTIILNSLPETGKKNLDTVDTGYLVRLMTQMALQLQAASDPTLKETLVHNIESITSYLMATRGYLPGNISGYTAMFEPKMSLEEIQKHVDELFNGESLHQYKAFEAQNYENSPAIHALFKLAEYFGYKGMKTEKDLQAFFLNKTSMGLYWDGDVWRLQEEGLEIDDKMGEVVTVAMINRVIKRMREQPENILEHRGNAFMDYWSGAQEYETQVKEMENTLSKGLEEAKERDYGMGEAEALSGEAEIFAFNPEKAEIDYNQPPEALKKGYADAIEYTKTHTGWTQLNYKIIDENTIELLRSDSHQKTILTRSNKDHWECDNGVYRGLTLLQAIVLGNLTNKVANVIESENETGASNSPFYTKDGDVMFNRNLNFWNELDIMEAENSPMAFYEQVDISPEDIAKNLNYWYSHRAA